jgi:hypothetical protein
MAEFDPEAWPRFFQLPDFTREWDSHGLGDEALRALESAIMDAPDRHPVIKGTGGLRKVRFAAPGEGRGKSGAYRVAYYSRLADGTVILAVLWAKNEKANLTAAERSGFEAFSRKLDALLKKGAM